MANKLSYFVKNLKQNTGGRGGTRKTGTPDLQILKKNLVNLSFQIQVTTLVLAFGIFPPKGTTLEVLF